MNTGFGFTEILVVVTLVLVFFGSKEMPGFMREIAKFTAKVRRYSDRIKRELDNVARTTEPNPEPFAEQISRKKELRTRCGSASNNLSSDEREEMSARIASQLLECDSIKNGLMIMVYVDMGAEVQTRLLISQLIAAGKRVAIPYCIPDSNDLGVAEIFDVVADIVPGVMQIPEPRPELRKSFFKSDLQAVICPGVAFDRQGGRLGRGKGYYDIFLRELRSRVPLVGIAYQCQILEESLPFEYHDIAMDIIITEEGTVFRAPEVPDPTAPLAG